MALTGFAEACYNQNSIEELIDALRDGIVDQTDCDTWKISHQEWRDAICDAILARIESQLDTASYAGEG